MTIYLDGRSDIPSEEGSGGGGGNTPDPVSVIDDDLSGASISGDWDVTTPTGSTITVVSDIVNDVVYNKVRLHAPAGGDQRPSLVWNQNLFGVRPWYWRYYAKRLTTDIAYTGTYLAVGFRRTDGQALQKCRFWMTAISPPPHGVGSAGISEDTLL